MRGLVNISLLSGLIEMAEKCFPDLSDFGREAAIGY